MTKPQFNVFQGQGPPKLIDVATQEQLAEVEDRIDKLEEAVKHLQILVAKIGGYEL